MNNFPIKTWRFSIDSGLGLLLRSWSVNIKTFYTNFKLIIMEKIMLKNTLFTALVLGSASTFAASVLADDTPSICPTADVIKSQPLTNVETSKHCKGKLVASSTGNYGTNQEWTLKIFGFKKKEQTDLLITANNVLQTVSGGGNPAFLNKHKNVWVCKYTAEHGYKAIAFTPAN